MSQVEQWMKDAARAICEELEVPDELGDETIIAAIIARHATAAAPISPDIHEAIGRIMHESWSKTKRAQGFHGPNENGTMCNTKSHFPEHASRCAHYHADLIPWEQLPEKQKDINRHAFDAVLESGLLVPAAAPASELEAVLERISKWAWDAHETMYEEACEFNEYNKIEANRVLAYTLKIYEEAAAAIRAMKGKGGGK